MKKYGVTECFILTKWYVNNKEPFESRKLKNSFILTKWYVNLLTLSET
ncbi:hypothetical protein QU5_2942 [Clostridioides difficile P45]|nr:hypothetical protein QU5_2942 [Clostridioides difficile P45]